MPRCVRVHQCCAKVDWLRWSILTYCVTPQSGNQVSTSLGDSGLCWTVFARNRDTVVPAEGNGDLQTLTCVLVARPRWCPTLSNSVLGQNWMAAYLNYTLQMKTLFCGWPIMVDDTDTRRRILSMPDLMHIGNIDFLFHYRATYTGIVSICKWSICKSPFPSAGTAVFLFCAKTVQQRPLLLREVETRLPGCGVTH